MFEDLLHMRYLFHPDGNHTIAPCNQLKKRGLSSKADKGKAKQDLNFNKDKNNKDRDDQGGGNNFQHPKGNVAVIFGGVTVAASKSQKKLTLRQILAAEPSTPKYLPWSEYPIHFTRDDQWTSYSNAGHYPLP